MGLSHATSLGCYFRILTTVQSMRVICVIALAFFVVGCEIELAAAPFDCPAELAVGETATIRFGGFPVAASAGTSSSMTQTDFPGTEEGVIVFVVGDEDLTSTTFGTDHSISADGREFTIRGVSEGSVQLMGVINFPRSILDATCNVMVVAAAPTDDGDCEPNCPESTCGDDSVDAGEQCDDGNTESGDGCRADCTNETCGDGIVDDGEECDDSNNVDGDGCASDCAEEQAASADTNSLSLHWPIDTGVFPPMLALSPNEAQFAGVAYIEGPFEVRWTVKDTSVDPRSECDPCDQPTITPGNEPSLDYPDGALIVLSQDGGLLVGTWGLRTQIFNTDTGLDWAGFEDFNLVVDPGAFQVIAGANWSDITLSLFGDMPGASRTEAVGSCAVGEAVWSLEVLGGAVVDTRCVDIAALDPLTYSDWSITGLGEGDYTASIRYVDATPSKLGPMLWERSFKVQQPSE